MTTPKRRQFEQTLSALELRYGAKSVRKASELAAELPPHVSTGVPALDALTGCRGIPLGAMTLLSGQITSGKLTLAYQILAQAQRQNRKGKASEIVAILDLGGSNHGDALQRCGIDTEHVVIVRSKADASVVSLLLKLVQSRQVRAILLDSLADLALDNRVAKLFNQHLDQLTLLLRQNGNCALLVIDEPTAPWLRWFNLDASWAIRRWAGLHIELRREQVIHDAGLLQGYQAEARILKSAWTRSQRSLPLQIELEDKMQVVLRT